MAASTNRFDVGSAWVVAAASKADVLLQLQGIGPLDVVVDTVGPADVPEPQGVVLYENGQTEFAASGLQAGDNVYMRTVGQAAADGRTQRVNVITA